MPHQCVRCSKVYDDGDKVILSGCNCGSKLFFYIKKEKFEKLNQTKELELTSKQKTELEKDVYEIIGTNEPEQPVVLDFESIRVLQPGKYELDLVSMFKKEPMILKLDEGKYVIDIPETFQNLKK